MNFSNPLWAAYLGAWEHAPDDRTRAEAHNFLFDERVDPARLAAVENFIPADCADDRVLRDFLVEFVERNINTAPPHIPPTFTAANGAAAMARLSPEQKLLRLEDLRRPLANSGLSGDDLQRLLDDHANGSSAGVAFFVDQWNRARDNRPAFAAFKDQVLDDIHAPDWEDRLRDRLGLNHFRPIDGPLPVALMEYTVDDILVEATQHAGADFPVCAPTCLDLKPNSQFFPTPRELPAGAPMALLEIQDDTDLIAEVLHFRLTYRVEHLTKLGQINGDVPDVEFKTLRNNQLTALQLAADREDFGLEV